MKIKLLSACFAFALFSFFAPSVLAADSACNEGNYTKANTIYVSPSAGENNQTQINAAIAAAPVGGSVFLKKGIYIISQPIKIKSDIILEGDKEAVVQLKNHAGWKNIKYLGVGNGSIADPIIGGNAGLKNVEIKCFTIDGNYIFRSASGGGNSNRAFFNCICAADYKKPCHPWDVNMASCETATADRYLGNGYYTLIKLSNGSNYSVHDMILQDGANDGLQISNASDIRFYNNYVNAMGHEGVFALSSHGIEVYGNNFIIRASDGVRGDDCYDYIIHNNEFSSYNNKDSSAGIQIDNKRGTPISNIQIYNNLFHDIWNGGIWLSVGSAALSGTSWPVSIHHNIFVGNGYSTNSAVGPTGGIMSPANIASIIYNNTFDGNYGYGVYDPNGKSKIINNIITGTVAGKYSAAGRGVGVSGGAEVSYNVFNKNTGGDYTRGGTGNYTGDPFYYKPGNDYHLQSIPGRWDPALSQWVSDAKNSPAIDAGTPFSTNATYGAYANEPQENGSRMNAGAYGNTSQASLTGNDRQVAMPPAPTTAGAVSIGTIGTGVIGGTSTGVDGGTGTGGTTAGESYIPGTSTGGTGSGSFTGSEMIGTAGSKSDGPAYYDPRAAVTAADSGIHAVPAVSLPEAERAPLFPRLGSSADTATGACGLSTETGGLVPCGRNTDNPDTDWNECDACDLCSSILMGQLIIEFLIRVAGVAATLAIIFAGFLYIFAVGKVELISRAKAMIKYILIGFVIVFTAWLMVDSILTILGYIDPIGGEWYTVC